MLVFDLDDTLYLERDFVLSGYRHLETWVAENHQTAGFGERCRAHFEAGERRHVFDRACDDLGLVNSPELIATLVMEYRSHQPSIALCPDAGHYLRRHEGLTGLITDGPPATQSAKITALGLESLIDHVLLTGEWGPGFAKPHPRAFETIEALSLAGPLPIYVADNPAKDFVTPKARGWRTVQVVRPGAVHDPRPPDDAHAAAQRIESFDALDAVLTDRS